MNRFVKAVACAALVSAAGGAQAALLNFNFAMGSGSEPGVHEVESNGVFAAAYDDGLATLNDDLLWYRNEENDHGLGVCDDEKDAAPEDDNCGTGDGNELDNVDTTEVIVLHNTNGGDWISLWVSSLDGDETGTVLWTNDLGSIDLMNSFSYMAGDFDGGVGDVVEGDILDLPAASGFVASSEYLLFVAGDLEISMGDNDYLIWKGTIDVPSTVPEPASLGLLGLGMLAFGFMSGRRRAR